MKNVQNKRVLYFFTLAWDENNLLLSHTIDWIKCLASKVDEIVVIAPRINASNVSDAKIKFEELGGGSFIKRTKIIARLLFVLRMILHEKREKMVFYHMITYPAIILSPIFKIYRIKQGLWYSHQYADFGLRVAVNFVDVCFSTVRTSFPLKSSKLIELGHAIIAKHDFSSSMNRNGFVVLGRVARVKRIEDLFIAIRNLGGEQCKVDIWGPVEDAIYAQELLQLSQKLALDVEFRGILKLEQREVTLSRYHAIYSGTLGSVDKAPLEGAVQGCYVVASNVDTIVQSGMSHIYSGQIGTFDEKISLERQIKLCETIKEDKLSRREIAHLCRQKNRLEFLAEKIYQELVQ